MSCQSCKFSERIIAYRVDGDVPADKSTRMERRLCMWAEAHPERFLDAPQWLTRDLPVFAGHLIDEAPECPAWEIAP